MEGKTCLITGASDGIGYVSARELARKGAGVIVVGRNVIKTEAAVKRIIDETGNDQVRFLLADLSSQGEVRQLATEVKRLAPRIDVLINNAGAIFLSNETSADGLEMTFALNHMSYYVLTILLLDTLRDSAPSRVINVSSAAHKTQKKCVLEELPEPGAHRGWRAYARSKLCNLLFTYEMARRVEGTGVTVNALHPGSIRTNIGRNNGLVGWMGNFYLGLRGVTVEQGAETTVYLATSDELEGVTGRYFEKCRAVQSSRLSYDRALAGRLWNLSERLTEVSEL